MPMASMAPGAPAPTCHLSSCSHRQPLVRTRKWSRGRLTCTSSALATAPHPAPDSALVVIQTAQGSPHIEQVARLRAEAYYENDRSRFVESFKKQFVAQEVESLQKRTARGSKGAPQVECLVALPPSGENTVLGCIDIRLPFSCTAQQPQGVPPEDPQGAYLLNVVVHEDHRGQGVGKALMLAAMQRAAEVWNAVNLYTHVEADNEVAYRLYTRCGFEEHSTQSKYSNTTALGRLILLQATAVKAA